MVCVCRCLDLHRLPATSRGSDLEPFGALPSLPSHPGAAPGPWTIPSCPWAIWRPGGGTVLAGDAQGRAASPQPLPGLFLQARFTVGMFTVYPGFGSIHPGDEQTITVDCHAEPLGPCEEHLSIDISDRDPSDNPLGIPYTLLAESCLPGTPIPRFPWPDLLLLSTQTS